MRFYMFLNSSCKFCDSVSLCVFGIAATAGCVAWSLALLVTRSNSTANDRTPRTSVLGVLCRS
eukprot:523746-Amphidinium_carterae.1